MPRNRPGSRAGSAFEALELKDAPVDEYAERRQREELRQDINLVEALPDYGGDSPRAEAKAPAAPAKAAAGKSKR